MNPESTAHEKRKRESTAHGKRKRKKTAQAPKVVKLNDSVYQLYRPAGTRSLQVVFFHGFQLEDYESAHTTTWTSGDGSVWPQTWLVEKFPDAHVLSVSYNRWVTSDRDAGTMDLFNICENLTSDLLSANREEPRCPIILVGHSFGGLVLKALCVHMSTQRGRKRDSDTKSSLENFLNDLKGVFFYATPHRGISKEALAVFAAENQSLLENVKTLSTAASRTEFDFSPISQEYKWRIVGLGESQPIKKTGILAQLVGGEDLGVTAEASSRYGWRFNIAENTNHITITRPIERTQRNFTALTGLLSEIKGVEVERPVHQTRGIPECHEGLERSSREVVQKLENMENLKNARVLGIVGMGGIGKTTIAKAVFNIISNEFEYTCFVDNVKEITSGDRKLEDRVLGDFHQHGMRKDGNNWSTLRGKKILLVMDDVNSVDQLKILPKPGDFGVGSRVIITSRDHSILDFYARYDFHEVEFLRESEAKELFCQLAFGSQTVPKGNQHLEADVVRVLEKCQGLPLTLEMAGSYLKGHDGEAEFWEETIVKLGKGKDIKGEAKDRVWASILEMSYYALAQVEQQMFLEAGTCFFEQPLERALAVWRSEHGSSITGWKNLLDKSMVKQVRKTKWKRVLLRRNEPAYREIEYMEVWVHEHFRDWAKKKCEGHMVIGMDEEAERAINLLKANKVKAGGTQTLRLSDRNQKTKLQLSLFNKVKNLKYLELEGILHEGSVKTCPRLSMLRWNYQVPSQDSVNKSDQVLPFNEKQMNKLAVLELSRMKIGKEFPEALQNLVNLRILSLSHLEGLDHLPKDFGNLSSLKQLELEGLQISTLPDSFCKLSALTHLSIVSCSSLKKLPDSFGTLKSLKDLYIVDCLMLEVLPENLRGLFSLKRLELRSCSPSSRLPDNVGTLSTLKELTIWTNWDRGLEELSEKFGNLSALTNLTLVYPSLQRLPESFGNLCSLTRLKLTSFELNKMPESFGTLTTLKSLAIDCQVLEQLPESFGNLSALTHLTLTCDSLGRLPDSFWDLCSLERLELSSSQLRRLPENVVTLCTLKTLAIECSVLEELPESFGNLSALTDLTLRCDSLGRLPDSFWDLCSLERLKLSSSQLRRLPENVVILSTLKTLAIECSVLEELPESFGNLSALTDLTIRCDSLGRLPDSFRDLCSLEILRLSSSQLRRLPKNVVTLCTLKILAIECSVLEELPESFGNLSALTLLTLRECSVLEELPESFGNLSALTHLTLRCDNLGRLPKSFWDLCSLERLELSSSQFRRLPENVVTLCTLKTLAIKCSKLKKLPESFGNLSALTDLTLRCDSLGRLPKSFRDLCSLERLELSSSQLRRLPENVVTLCTLKTLAIEGSVLEELPESFGNLSALTHLTLRCDSLERLPESFRDLCSLERLELSSSQLRRLPENVVTLCTLKTLAIECSVLEELPESFGNLSALTHLTLRCDSLERLPESFRDLCSLERLELRSYRLERLPKRFGTLASLKSLEIYCWKLEELPKSLGNLSALTRLTLGCDSLGRLPKSLGNLSALTYLTLRCDSLGRLPKSLGNLSALTCLSLRCGSLGILPESFKHLYSLDTLVIMGCPELTTVPTVSELGGQGRLTIYR